jgi:Ca-activated chloride channel family protein
VTFQAPLLLATLAAVPLIAAVYVLMQRRRRRYAVRYTNVDLLASVAGRSYTRHLPALLGLLALAALLVAIARPQHVVAAELHQANVILVTDTSGSMLATDVKPTRLAAAQKAARTFIKKVPNGFRIGLVTISNSAQETVGPTTDHDRVTAAINGLKVHGATAMGDALQLAIDSARVPVSDGLGGSRRLPAAIVLLSDGGNTRGADPITVVQKTKKYKIPIYTVALGTATGVLQHKDPQTGQVTSTERVPPDPLTLQDIARDTGGQFFAAPDARKLQAVYANLGTRLAKTKVKRQVTSAFAGGALVLLLVGAGFGMARGGRLP